MTEEREREREREKRPSFPLTGSGIFSTNQEEKQNACAGRGRGGKGGSPWCPINPVAMDKTPQSQHSLALESLRQHWLTVRRGTAPLTGGGPCFGASQPGRGAAPPKKDAQVQMRLSVHKGQDYFLLVVVQVCRWGGMGDALLVRASQQLGQPVIVCLESLRTKHGMAVVKGLKWVLFAFRFGWGEAFLAQPRLV